MPTLIVCGLTHHGSSLAIREQLAMPKHCLIPALRSLVSQKGIHEAVILSTCNRTEIYVVAETRTLGMEALEEFFARAVGTHTINISPDLTEFDSDAVAHLFRVTSGFDSVVIGENQILGQVREAIATAQAAKASGSRLNKLFNLALHCGKRVRTETGIARRAVSVSSAAVELADQRGAIDKSPVVVVGAGKIGMLCTKHLLGKKKATNLTVFNQSADRLDSLKSSIKNPLVTTVSDYRLLEQLCSAARAIFVATAAPDYIITPAMLASGAGEKLIFDLSVPRNVDPKVSGLPGITLYTVDDLSAVVRENLEQRREMMISAQPILEDVMLQYKRWVNRRPACVCA